jgi:hypothetical protein
MVDKNFAWNGEGMKIKVSQGFAWEEDIEMVRRTGSLERFWR